MRAQAPQVAAPKIKPIGGLSAQAVMATRSAKALLSLKMPIARHDVSYVRSAMGALQGFRPTKLQGSRFSGALLAAAERIETAAQASAKAEALSWAPMKPPAPKREPKAVISHIVASLVPWYKRCLNRQTVHENQYSN